MRARKDDVRELIQRSAEELDATIRDVRATIFELQVALGRLGTPGAPGAGPRVRPRARVHPRSPAQGTVDTAVTEQMRESLLKVRA